jgi:hypothetical protein
MKKLNTLYLCLICTLLYNLTACRKFVEIDGPKNQLTSDVVFADSVNAEAAIVGIYSQIAAGGSFGLLAGGMTLYPGLSADELNTTASDATLSAFYNNNILPSSDKNQPLYNLGFKYIYSANACIEGFTLSSQIPENVKEQMIGETRFLRAFVYFNLVNLYGELPIITSADYHATRLVARSSKDLVYQQIISDLKYAQMNLSPAPVVKERAGYYAATALLAKTYLFTGQYAQAVAEADKIITSGKYTLVNDLNSVFLASSSETIWNTLGVIPLQATYEGLYFIPSGATVKPKYTITTSLYNSFEAGDNRKTSWIRANTIAGVAYPYPYKYKVRTTTSAPTENYVISRLAEVYLMRAEAKGNLGDISGARNDLDVIRKRAGLSNSSANDKVSVLLAVEKERRAELFCEWGNRWLDLKRTNRALTVLGPSKPNLNQNTLLYPIPLYELNSNPNLSQNAGY